VTINPGSEGSSITNTGYVTGGNVIDPPPPPPPVCPDGSAPPCATPVPTTTLAFTKSAVDLSGSPLAVSDTVRYILRVTNTGAYTAYNVTVTDDLPDEVTCQLLTGDNAPPICADPLIWTVGDLLSGASAAISIEVTINLGSEGSSITNTGSVTGSNIIDPPPPPPPVCPDGTLPDVNGECPNPPGPPPLYPCTSESDGYEEDDEPGQANTILFGYANRQTHNFYADTTDWVSFTARAGYVYTVTTSSWGQRADTELALFAQNGLTMLESNDDCSGATDFSSCIVWEAPEDGTYYVQIVNRSRHVGCYTDYDVWVEFREEFQIYLPLVLRDAGPAAKAELELGPTGVISHTCPDSYEVDDSWEQAAAIEPGIAQVHSFDSDPTFYTPDKDFVWFDVPLEHSRNITFTIEHITNTQVLLQLYDEHGAGLEVTGTTELAWTFTADGRYFLSVSPLTTTYGCADTVGYTLLMEYEPLNVVYLPLVLRNAGP
jgi:uncharacterized repeat protein (TIGR01451 family)